MVTITKLDNVHRILFLPSYSDLPRSASVYLSAQAYLPRMGKMLEG